jgi:hypothetical protein
MANYHLRRQPRCYLQACRRLVNRGSALSCRLDFFIKQTVLLSARYFLKKGLLPSYHSVKTDLMMNSIGTKCLSLFRQMDF